MTTPVFAFQKRKVLRSLPKKSIFKYGESTYQKRGGNSVHWYLLDFEKTWYSWLLELLKSLQNTIQIIILNIHTFHAKLWKVSDNIIPLH